MFGRNEKKGNYAYTVARVKAKKAKLLKDEDYSKLMMMSVPDISRYISEVGYLKEMTDLANRNSGLDLLEHATYLNMAKVFRTILEASQGELHEVIRLYLAKWDIWNLKIILRSKSYGLDAEGMRDDFVLAGSINAESLDKLISLDSDEEILASFCKMAQTSIPPEVIAEYKTNENLGIIEDYLDKYRYAKLISGIDSKSRPTHMFLEYMRREIDTKNFETIIKLKSEGIEGEKIVKYFIPGGKQLDITLVTKFANMNDVDSIISESSDLDFYEDIKEALNTESSILRGLAAGMKKYEIRQAKRFSHMHPLSVIPVLDYMIHKESEVNNIRIIARGLESGLDKDVIKGLLVI